MHDHEARDELALEYLPLADRLAGIACRRLPSHVDGMEIQSAA